MCIRNESPYFSVSIVHLSMSIEHLDYFLHYFEISTSLWRALTLFNLLMLDFGVEKGIKLEGLSEAQISKALEDLVKAVEILKA
ncbi:uncharacterized protein DS421_18g620200 [Arachis hypogaea]|nr:uncharacterized protein DS421_18g620200 [Arachis hypogaea]